MGLYRKLIICSLLASLTLPLSNDLSTVNNISIIDFCKLKDNQGQFNLGYQKNNFIDSYYFSIDKLISYNFIASTKLSLLRNNVLEVYNQNSLLFNFDNNPFNLLVSINYLTDNFKVKSWLNFGFVLELFKNHPILDDNVFIGMYYDIGSNDLNSFNYYIRFNKEVDNQISVALSSRYNNSYNQFNNNIELAIKI